MSISASATVIPFAAAPSTTGIAPSSQTSRCAGWRESAGRSRRFPGAGSGARTSLRGRRAPVDGASSIPKRAVIRWARAGSRAGPTRRTGSSTANDGQARRSGRRWTRRKRSSRRRTISGPTLRGGGRDRPARRLRPRSASEEILALGDSDRGPYRSASAPSPRRRLRPLRRFSRRARRVLLDPTRSTRSEFSPRSTATLDGVPTPAARALCVDAVREAHPRHLSAIRPLKRTPTPWSRRPRS